MDRAQSKGLWEQSVKLFFVGYSVTVVVIVVFLKSSSLFSSLTSTHSAVFIAQRLRSIPSLLNFFSLFFCVRIFYFHPQPPTLVFFAGSNRLTRSLLNYLQFSNNPFSFCSAVVIHIPSLSLIYRFNGRLTNSLCYPISYLLF